MRIIVPFAARTHRKLCISSAYTRYFQLFTASRSNRVHLHAAAKIQFPSSRVSCSSVTSIRPIHIPSERYIFTFITFSHSTPHILHFLFYYPPHFSASPRYSLCMLNYLLDGPVSSASSRDLPRASQSCTSGFLTTVRRCYEVERGRYEYLNAPQGENIRATARVGVLCRAGLSITVHRGDNHRVVEASRRRCADAVPCCAAPRTSATVKVLPPDRFPPRLDSRFRFIPLGSFLQKTTGIFKKS